VRLIQLGISRIRDVANCFCANIVKVSESEQTQPADFLNFNSITCIASYQYISSATTANNTYLLQCTSPSQAVSSMTHRRASW